jgi:hypothetical protein
MRKHAYIQCAEVIEHFFQARTQGFETRVAPHARSLTNQPQLKDENEKYNNGSFAA